MILRLASDRLGDSSLETWTSPAIERYITDGLNAKGWRKTHKPWTARTANLYLQAIGQFCRWAMRQGYLEADPTTGIPKARQEKRHPFFYSEAHVKKLLEACRKWDEKIAEPWLEFAVCVALGTAARKHELANLEWTDVDMTRRRITLRGKAREERTIPLEDIAYNALKDVLKDDRHGKIIKAGQFQVLRDRSLERALTGIPYRGWRGFRHTYASHKVMGGVPVRTVMELLGHKTINTTMRYAHLSPQHLADARGSLPY